MAAQQCRIVTSAVMSGREGCQLCTKVLTHSARSASCVQCKSQTINGHPPAVLQAEKKMLEANYNKEYLPIEGLAEFRKATIDLMLGPNSKAAQEVTLSAWYL